VHLANGVLTHQVPGEHETAVPEATFTAAKAGFLQAVVAPQTLGELVPTDMANAFTVCGTPDEVRASLLAYEGVVDAVKLSPPTYGLAPEQTRAAQQQLLGVVADITGGTPPSAHV